MRRLCLLIVFLCSLRLKIAAMQLGGHRKSVYFFTALGACLVALAVALNVGWILLNWREVALLVLGVIFFGLIIGGLVFNTIFLVREIRRNEQHDSFINAVTHELKTPLASIRLYLETLQRRDVDEKQRREFYDIMLADSDRLLHTVEQVLRAGRTGHRRRHTHYALVDMAELVQACIEVTRTGGGLPINAITYSEQIPPGERPAVKGEPDELRAAVSNLLDNAVKYSEQEVRVSVEVSLDADRRVILHVKDNGIGIPREQLRRVFKRFYRVPRIVMSRVKGTGLGLFIVRSVIEKHGGKVFAESEGEGRGSTFTISLPRAPVDNPAVEIAGSAHETVPLPTAKL
jgi:two-component system, OmpR family, sensor histidine kinase SenX3